MASERSVQYISSEDLDKVEQKEKKVHVVLKTGNPNAGYDLAVAANKQNSRARVIVRARTAVPISIRPHFQLQSPTQTFSQQGEIQKDDTML